MKYKNGKKNIFLLGSSSFMNDFGSEMIVPIIPLYLSSLGGSGIAVGLASGLREGLSSIFKIFGGWISDLHGKSKKFIFWGYLISFIFKILLGFADSWQAIITFLSLERFGKLRDAPRDVIISKSIKEKGRGFGLHQMMDAAGGVVGTITVLFLFWNFNLSYSTIILIAAGISGFSLVPLIFVREPKLKAINKGLIEGIELLSGKLKYFIFVSVIFTLANFGLSMFLILRAKEITGSIVWALALHALFFIVFTLFVIPLGSWSDRIGRKKVLLLGYFLFLLVAVSLIFINNLTTLIIAFIIYGFVYATTHSNQRAFVSDMAGEMKGTALGSFHAFTGLANIPAGLVAGILWNISYQWMFGYLAVIALLALILLYFVKERNHHMSTKTLAHQP